MPSRRLPYIPGELQFITASTYRRTPRLASTTSRTVYYDGAYAPYGESYAESGTADHSFTGQEQDIAPSGQYPLYDFLAREYNPTWGRWISPDPMRGNVLNPQSLNRYAYVNNNPLSLTDPMGLDSWNPADPCSGTGWETDAECRGPSSGCNMYGYDPACAGYPGCVAYGTEGCIPFPPGYPSSGGGGGGYGGGGGSASSAAPAGQPPLAGGPVYGALGCPFPKNSMGLCGLSPDYYTAQLGGSINLNFWGLLSFHFSGGFIIDNHGHIAVYETTGGGATVGGSGSIGLEGALSNGQTVCDVTGPFANASGTFGLGGTVSADVFHGNSAHGPVTGGGVTAGAGGGASGSVSVTSTSVTPLNSVPCR